MPATLIGLESSGLDLFVFDSATPGTTNTVPVTGLDSNEVLVGIDYRPANGTLYGLAMNGVGDGALYTLNPTTGAATHVVALTADPGDLTSPYIGLGGSIFGIDFDPQFDRLRIVSDLGENLQVNPTTGLVITDDDLGPVANDIIAVAHNNNIKGASTTTLFGISAFDDQVYTFVSPSGGQTTATSQALGLDIDDSIGFDIAGTDAYAALTVNGISSLYLISLTDGAPTLIGAIGSSLTLKALTIQLDDVTPPVVTDMIRLDPDPNSTTSVRYLVTFSEPVTGVDPSDFGVTVSGSVTGASVSNVFYDNTTNQATVTVTFTSGVGTVTLSLIDDDTIVNGSNIPLGGVGKGNGDFTGPTYTIVGNDPSATIDLATKQADPTNLQPVRFIVTFTEPVVGFESADIEITGTAGATTAKVTTTDSITFEVEVSGATQAGTIIISFPAGAAQDLDGNDSVDPTIINNTVTLNENEPPAITMPASITIQQNANAVFTGANLISIADPDADADLLQVRIVVDNGIFTLASTAGITFISGANATSAMVIQGALSSLNTALNGSFFQPTANFLGTASVVIDVDDLGHNGGGGPKTDTQTTDIVVEAATGANQPPVITAPTTATTNQNTTLSFLGALQVTIADPDSGSGPIEVTLSASNGTITILNVIGITFLVGDGVGDTSMKFTGAIDKVNAALGGLQYDPNTNFTGSDTLTIAVNDQGNTGTGGAKSDTKNVSITVNAAGNTAPVANNDSFTTTRNQALSIGPPGVLGNDTDADGNTLTAVLVTGVPASAGTLTLNSNGSFVFTPATNFAGTTTFTYRANDGTTNSNIATVTINVLDRSVTPLTATGAGPGGTSHVMVYNADGSVRFSFNAFDAAFRGGVSVATGDVDGDGIDDIICGAGPGGDPHVIVYSGANLSIIASFYAFDIGFAGGVSVAAGDTTGDGKAEIIVGAGVGGAPLVKVFSGNGQAIQGILAFDAAFLGGVSVAASDLDRDGKADIIVGAGPGGGPHVVVYKGGTSTLMQSFYAFDQAFGGGVNVAGGQFNNRPAIFTAAGPTGVPVVQIFDFNTNQPAAAFFAFDRGDINDEATAAKSNGVKIGTEVALDGTTLILLGESFNNEPLTRVIEANTLAERRRFLAYDSLFLGGVFVG